MSLNTLLFLNQGLIGAILIGGVVMLVIITRNFTIPKICTMERSTDHCKIPGSYGHKWPSLSELYFTLFDKDFEEGWWDFRGKGV